MATSPDSAATDRTLKPVYECLPQKRIQQLQQWEAAAAEQDDREAWESFEMGRESAEMSQLFTMAESRQLLIVEDAGAGKTVFSYRLQTWLCEASPDVQHHFSGPVLAIRFGMDDGGWPELDAKQKISQRSQQLVKAISNRLERTTSQPASDCARAVELAVAEGRLVIILDAFDQGTGPPEQSVLDALRDEPWQDTWVVVTSRAAAVTHLERAPEGAMEDDAWRVATLMLWDVNQQARYLDHPPRENIQSVLDIRKRDDWEESNDSRHREALATLLPCYDERIERLLGVPLLLQLVYDIAYQERQTRRPQGPLQLEAMQTRYAIFQKAWEGILSRDRNGVAKEYAKAWAEMLAAVAWVMVRHKLWNYRVPAEQLTVDELIRQARETVSAEIAWDQAWDAMIKFAPLADHNVFEQMHREASLSFRLRGWMEYFAGQYLATWSRDEDLERLLESQLGSDPECHWVWRFSLEAASRSAPHSPWLNALRALFDTPPPHHRRPTELMWRTLTHLKKVSPVTEKQLSDQLHQTFIDECLLSDDEEIQGIAASLVPEWKWRQHVPEVTWGDLKQRLFDQAEQTLHDEANPVPLAERKLTTGELEEDLHFARCPPPASDCPDALTFHIGTANEVKEPWLPARLQVRLPQSFLLQRTAVTVAQYALFDPVVGAENSERVAPEVWRPATEVSYLDARMFAVWVGGRLPDEAHWEFACRAGHDGPEDRYGVPSRGPDGRLSYSCDIQSESANFGTGRAVAVRCYRPNDWGLYQMHGNVWEWCLDTWQGGDPYQRLRGEIGPADWQPWGDVDPLAVLVSFVLRGGSFNLGDFPRYLRAAYRFDSRADRRYDSFGFRLLY